MLENGDYIHCVGGSKEKALRLNLDFTLNLVFYHHERKKSEAQTKERYEHLRYHEGYSQTHA